MSEREAVIVGAVRSPIGSFGGSLAGLAAARHLLAPGGVLLAMKGRLPAEELSALPPGTAHAVHAIEVPGLEEERHVVAMRAAPDPATRP